MIGNISRLKTMTKIKWPTKKHWLWSNCVGSLNLQPITICFLQSVCYSMYNLYITFDILAIKFYLLNRRSKHDFLQASFNTELYCITKFG